MGFNISDINSSILSNLATEIDRSGVSKNDTIIDEIEFNIFKKQSKLLLKNKIINRDEYNQALSIRQSSETTNSDSIELNGFSDEINEYELHLATLKDPSAPTLYNLMCPIREKEKYAKNIAIGVGVGATAPITVPTALTAFSCSSIGGLFGGLLGGGLALASIFKIAKDIKPARKWLLGAALFGGVVGGIIGGVSVFKKNKEIEKSNQERNQEIKILEEEIVKLKKAKKLTGY